MKRILLFSLIFFSVFFNFNQRLCADEHKVILIQFDDLTINPITAEYISQAIDRAAKLKAECLIIKLDTPGGLLSSTHSIVKAILASMVPVVVYIAPSGSHAGSAGVFITYASHIAVMAPSTNIGAAHPVQLGEGPNTPHDNAQEFKKILREVKEEISKSTKPESPKKNQDSKKSSQDETSAIDSPADPMSEKILNDTVAWIKALANKRNRNSQWAVESVVKSSAITETEALRMHVIDLIAKDENELLEKIDGMTVAMPDQPKVLHTRNVRIESIEMTSRQKFLNTIAHPNIVYILFMMGFYGLLYEFTHPGLAVPGVLGLVSIFLAFVCLQYLSANFAGLALMIAGIGFFIAEAFAPGIGIFTFAGVLCSITGALLLFNTSGPGWGIPFGEIVIIVLVTLVVTITLVRLYLRLHRQKSISGASAMIGAKGEVARAITAKHHGKVYVHGEIWNAESDMDLDKGDEVIIESIEGLRLKVKKSG